MNRFDIILQQMKNEVISLGVRELLTPEDVDEALKKSPGTSLLFVNSVCGGGIARPALALGVRHWTQPDLIATVFASTDREATARARSYLTGMPPSSPSFALLRDGKLIQMIHRSDIEMREPEEVAVLLTGTFDRYCTSAH